MNYIEYIVLEAAGEWGTIASEGTRFLVSVNRDKKTASYKEVRESFVNQFMDEPEFAFVCIPVSEIEKSIEVLEKQIAKKRELLGKFPSAVEEWEEEESSEEYSDDEDLKGFEKSLAKETSKRERRYLERLDDSE
jgi:hypothetical protein